jgi:hypothetical protein
MRFTAVVLAILAVPVAFEAGEAQVARRVTGTVAPPLMREPLRPGPAFLASALLPGTAQYLAGDERWVPYIAAEAYAWASYIDNRHQADRLSRRYRDLAWQVARRVSVGARRDSVFEYYEAMADPQINASGAYDLDKQTPGIQPETEHGTFNGDLWQLARELYSGGDLDFVPGAPAYESALAYYLERAIPERYAWAWGSSSLEQQAFGDLIRQSDAASRSATRYLGVIVANHLVSAVDALVTTRLRELTGGALRLDGAAVRVGGELRWLQSIHIRF